MTRIAVIGNAGGGKTTLCRALGRRLDLPVYSVDSVQWKPGWRAAEPSEVAAAQARWLAAGRWIIDGFGGDDLIAQRFAAADTIIFVDLPLYVHGWWALKRQITSVFRPRPEMPPKCPMLPMTWPLIKTMWFVHRHFRPRLMATLMQQRAQKRVIHLRSPQAICEFLAVLPQA